jgi:large subunit ribosomal protein L5
MELIRDKQKTAFAALKDAFKYTNPMQGAKVTKVVVSVGTGSFKDKKKNDVVVDRLAKITGQKAATRVAKQSIASFKLRQGDLVGYQVTLRGARMIDFLDRLVNIALPRTKDFRGLNPGAIDQMGNFTISIREHAIFPEISEEELKDIFGMAITVVTSAKTRDEATALIKHLGFPLKKEADGKVAHKRKREKKPVTAAVAAK